MYNKRQKIYSNLLVDRLFGEFGVRCVEDLVQELWSVGENFKQVNKLMWPFKLSSPKGGLRKKNQPYLNGGDTGPRDEFVNEFVQRMI